MTTKTKRKPEAEPNLDCHGRLRQQPYATITVNGNTVSRYVHTGGMALVEHEPRQRPHVVSKKQIDIAQLERVVVGCYTIMFNGEKDPFYEPKPGTIMHRLWKGSKLSFLHQKTWKSFVVDLREAAGKSGKTGSSYGEYSDVSSDGYRVPVAFTNEAYERVTRLFNHFLGRYERHLLRDLIIDEIQKPGHFELELLGLARNGYKNSDQARAAGIANICCLLDRMHDYYGRT